MTSMESADDCLSSLEPRGMLLVADGEEPSLENELCREEADDRVCNVSRGEFARKEAAEVSRD